MTGRCLYGAVSFRAEEVETDHHACHCGIRRTSAGTSGLFATKATGVTFDPAPFRLAREVCIDKKPPGYALAGDHPRWTEAETLERMTPT